MLFYFYPVRYVLQSFCFYFVLQRWPVQCHFSMLILRDMSVTLNSIPLGTRCFSQFPPTFMTSNGQHWLQPNDVFSKQPTESDRSHREKLAISLKRLNRISQLRIQSSEWNFVDNFFSTTYF